MLLNFKINVTVVKQMGKLFAVNYQLGEILFCGVRIFHVSCSIWYLTKSLKTLNEFNLVSVNSAQYSNIWNLSSSCCLHNLHVGSSRYWQNLYIYVCNRQAAVRNLAFTIAFLTSVTEFSVETHTGCTSPREMLS